MLPSLCHTTFATPRAHFTLHVYAYSHTTLPLHGVTLQQFMDSRWFGFSSDDGFSRVVVLFCYHFDAFPHYIYPT